MNALAIVGKFPRCVVTLVALGALGGGVACGGAPAESEATTAESREAIVSNAWILWSEAQHPNGAVTTEGVPSACEIRYVTSGGQSGGHMLVHKDSANKIKMSWMSYSPWADWLQVGTLSFSTKPACASLDGTYDSSLDGYQKSNQVALVAKGSGASNRFWIATWHLGDLVFYPFGTVPTPGQMVRDWSALSNEAFASAPAATVHNKKLLVVGRKSDNSLRVLSWPLHLETPSDPFGTGGPVAISTVPPLPSGWAAAGDPAIIHVPAAFGKAVLAVRATNGSGSTRHYRISTDGPTFSTWVRFGSTVSAGADPALDLGFDRETTPRITAYLRSNSDGHIHQASSNVGSATFEPFTAILSDVFVEGPAVAGGSLGFDGYHAAYGIHWGSNVIWGARSDPVAP